MAVVELEFWIDVISRTLVASDISGGAFSIPTFIAGDTVSLSIGLLKPDPGTGPGAYAKLQNSGITLKAAIGTPPAPLTNIDLNPSGTYVFKGDLPLNVAAISNLFTSTPTITVAETFEIQISDSGKYTSIQVGCNLKNELISSALVATTPPEVALGKNEAAATYVKLRGTTSFIMTDAADGSESLITLRNGQFTVSPLT